MVLALLYWLWTGKRLDTTMRKRMADRVVIMDFTPENKGQLPFDIYGERFYACPDLPLGMMQKLGGIRAAMHSEDEADLEPMLKLMDELLLDESAARFRAGTMNKDKMIGLGIINRLIPWLLEEYGLRPTQSSNPSSTGSGEDETGSPSTDIALPEASTSSESQDTPPSV